MIGLFFCVTRASLFSNYTPLPCYIYRTLWSHIPPRAMFYLATQRKGTNWTTILAINQAIIRKDLIPPLRYPHNYQISIHLLQGGDCLLLGWHPLDRNLCFSASEFDCHLSANVSLLVTERSGTLHNCRSRVRGKRAWKSTVFVIMFSIQDSALSPFSCRVFQGFY